MGARRIRGVRAAAARADLVAGRGDGRLRARLQSARAAAHRRAAAVSAGRRGARVPARHPALPALGAAADSDFFVAAGHCGSSLGASWRSATAPPRSSDGEQAAHASLERRENNRRHDPVSSSARASAGSRSRGGRGRTARCGSRSWRRSRRRSRPRWSSRCRCGSTTTFRCRWRRGPSCGSPA